MIKTSMASQNKLFFKKNNTADLKYKIKQQFNAGLFKCAYVLSFLADSKSNLFK